MLIKPKRLSAAKKFGKDIVVIYLPRYLLPTKVSEMVLKLYL